jgi:hypothetical protein
MESNLVEEGEGVVQTTAVAQPHMGEEQVET